jgi:hypothetical protein
MKKIFMLLIILPFLGCNKDNNENCVEYKFSSVENINGPKNAAVNSNIIIEVNHQVINGCGDFNKFKEIQIGNTRIIEIEAKYEGCICTMAVENRIVDYIFQPLQSGVYEFRFKKSDDEYIVAVINVE